MTMRIRAASVLMATLIATPATARADCGQDGQSACTGPVPTVDQVTAILAELTDPGRPAASKTDVVTPGFAPDDAETIDDHLHKFNSKGSLPFTFVVTDIQPAPADFAGAPVTAQANGHLTSTAPRPIVLVEKSGHWMITEDAAMVLMKTVWSHYSSVYVPAAPVVK